jgi:hypothetical protein
MLAYNIIRELMVTAAAKNGAEPREMSFKGTLQALTAFRDAMQTADPERQAQLWEELFVAIVHDRVGDRPEQVEPRAKNRRPKQYDLLNCSRQEARKRILDAA